MERRQVYIISLKLLALLGVVLVMSVMINSLFPVAEHAVDEKPAVAESPKSVELGLDNLSAGRMLLGQWGGKPVAVLKRIDPPADFSAGQPLNAQWRSVRADYFVFYNAVGAARCPLYLSPDGKQLKDTCTGIRYDPTGRRLQGSGEPLQIPPHYFADDNKLIIGQWLADE